MSSELLQLLKRIQPPKVKYKKPSEPSPELLALVGRLELREQLYWTEMDLLGLTKRLRVDVKLIEHLPHCKMCKFELLLDVERYNGTRALWYLNLDNSEYMEEQYPDCPKEENYRIDNYWAQVQRAKNGIKDDTNTMDFIMDRAKWAYKIIGNQITIIRRLLRMIRNWDYSKDSIEEFNEIYEGLNIL